MWMEGLAVLDFVKKKNKTKKRGVVKRFSFTDSVKLSITLKN